MRQKRSYAAEHPLRNSFPNGNLRPVGSGIQLADLGFEAWRFEIKFFSKDRQQFRHVLEAVRTAFERRYGQPVSNHVDEGGVEALLERTRRKPNLANRVDEVTEQATSLTPHSIGLICINGELGDLDNVTSPKLI